MGEVHDLHEAEDQAESDRYEGVDEPHEKAADDCLDDDVWGHAVSRGSNDLTHHNEWPNLVLHNYRFREEE